MMIMKCRVCKSKEQPNVKGLCKSCYMKEQYNKNREGKKEYMKRWKERNLERVKQIVKRWAENNPERCKENKNRWDKEHPEKLKEYSRIDYQRNKERKKERSRLEYESDRVKWYNRARRWVQTPRGRALIKISFHKRRCRMAQIIHDFTLEQWLLKVEATKNICPACFKRFTRIKIRSLTMNHEPAISLVEKGHIYTIDDVTPMCQSCNSKLHNKPFRTDFQKSLKKINQIVSA